MPPPAATQAAARLWTQPTPSFPARHSYRSNVEITRTLWWQTSFTRGRVREWKSGHNSVSVQNRTHVHMDFFDHEDLGNHLLQLCPKVVKHPVCAVFRYSVFLTFFRRHAVALCYKSEGRGFDSRWGHWIFKLTSFQPHCDPGVDSVSNRNEFEEYSWWQRAAGA
jgi:hypothetical protein